jgi:hypothetical protein
LEPTTHFQLDRQGLFAALSSVFPSRTFSPILFAESHSFMLITRIPFQSFTSASLPSFRHTPFSRKNLNSAIVEEQQLIWQSAFNEGGN